MRISTGNRLYQLALGIGAVLVLSGCATSQLGMDASFALQRPGATVNYANLGFRSGERFRIAVRPTADCYVYILHQGTDGSWSMLFPLSNVQSGGNFIRAGAWHEVPSEGWYRVDALQGVERFKILACTMSIKEMEVLRNMPTLTQTDVHRVLANVDHVYNANVIQRTNESYDDRVYYEIVSEDEFPVLEISLDMLHEG